MRLNSPTWITAQHSDTIAGICDSSHWDNVSAELNIAGLVLSAELELWERIAQPKSGERRPAKRCAELDIWSLVRPMSGEHCTAERSAELDVWGAFQAKSGERRTAERSEEPNWSLLQPRLENILLPSLVETLTFGACLNQGLENIVLPSAVHSLRFWGRVQPKLGDLVAKVWITHYRALCRA